MKRAALLLLLLLGCAHARQAPPLPTPAPAVVGWQYTDSLLAGRMRALAARLRAEGYVPLGPDFSEFLPAASRRAESFVVPANTCVLWLAVTSDTIVDLDAAIYTPEGLQVADDQRADAAPVLGGCSEATPRPFYLALHAYQGAGPVLAVMFGRPRGQGEPALLETHDLRRAELFDQLRLLEAHGYSGASPVHLSLAANRPLRLPVEQTRDSCFAVVVEVSPGLGSVELEVESGGRVLARGVADYTIGGMQWCVSLPESATLSVKTASGTGEITVARWSGPTAQTGGASALWMGEPPDDIPSKTTR